MIFPILIATAVPVPCAPTILDGDTIKFACTGEHVRITAIDAPELNGHCRPGRNCAPGDPIASENALKADLSQGSITIDRLGTDVWHRTVADVYVNGKSVSCLQLAGGYARFWPAYDKGGRIKRECAL